MPHVGYCANWDTALRGNPQVHGCLWLCDLRGSGAEERRGQVRAREEAVYPAHDDVKEGAPVVSVACVVLQQVPHPAVDKAEAATPRTQNKTATLSRHRLRSAEGCRAAIARGPCRPERSHRHAAVQRGDERSPGAGWAAASPVPGQRWQEYPPDTLKNFNLMQKVVFLFSHHG